MHERRGSSGKPPLASGVGTFGAICKMPCIALTCVCENSMEWEVGKRENASERLGGGAASRDLANDCYPVRGARAVCSREIIAVDSKVQFVSRLRKADSARMNF
jgi:hypothetical protein